jgi:peptidoglycan/xylan/chitin deacetylase (PgdA/CDA1 family)
MFTSDLSLLIQRNLAKFSGRKLRSRRDPRPVISFTFDDFPVSALHCGGAILSEYGIKGTYYAALGLMGKNTVVGEMFTPEHLKSLVQHGHELACHTYEHTRACDVPTPVLLTQCDKNRQSASSMCKGYECRNFSFPEGVVTVSAKISLQSLYDTCRTVEPGINTDPVDFSFLRANPIYSKQPIGHIKKKIRESHDRRGWLVFYTHDISETPSSYGCTAEYFQEVVRYAAESGAEILTVGEASRRFESCVKSA